MSAGFDGVEIKSRIVFNKRQVKTAGLISDNFSGPTVRHSDYGDVLQENYCQVEGPRVVKANPVVHEHCLKSVTMTRPVYLLVHLLQLTSDIISLYNEFFDIMTNYVSSKGQNLLKLLDLYE